MTKRKLCSSFEAHKKNKNSLDHDLDDSRRNKQVEIKEDSTDEENDQEENDDDFEDFTQNEAVSTENQKFELVRIPNKTSTTDSLNLENVENLFLQKDFDISKYLYKTIYCIDLGSSFIKGSKTIMPESGTDQEPTFFNQRFGYDEKVQYFPSRLFFHNQSERIRIGNLDKKQKKDKLWEELENIKKIFMVSELLEIGVQSKKIRVSYLIYKMITELLNIMCETRKMNDQPDFGKVGALFFTCPTGTSDFTKLLFRNCILKAYNIFVISPKLNVDDVYIIEEYVLLKYFSKSQEKASTIFADFGHLTLDVVVMELINGEYVITFKNGETGGMSLVHELLKKKNLDPVREMKNLFENHYQSDELPENWKPFEKELIKTLEIITKPLCMMILQKGVEHVHLSGAITKVKYFRMKFNNLFRKERLVMIKNELIPFMKDEYIRKPIPNVEPKYQTTGESALLKGFETIIQDSHRAYKEKRNWITPIVFKENKYDDTLPIQYQEQYVPAMLFQEKKEKKIVLNEMMFDMYVKQDSEIFIIKFSPLIDIKKIKEITFNNFSKVGVIEFIRFTRLVICFDPEQIRTSKFIFYTKLELEADFLVAHFYFTRCKTYYKSIIKIEKKGRMERIAINDASTIFKINEVERKTWYGLSYETLCIITSYSTIKSVKETFFEETNEKVVSELKPLEVRKKNLDKIPELKDGDSEFVRKCISHCVVCSKNVNPRCKHYTSYQTLRDYRMVFEKEIGLGYVCNLCYGTYLENK